MRAILTSRSSETVYCALLIVLSAAGSVPAMAQVSPPLDNDTASVQPAPKDHFWLRVTGERVNIRSRADVNSRIVGRVSASDTVEATSEEYGWFRILPPPGVHSLVAAEFIDRVGGSSGVVNVDTSLRVRVGSDLQSRDPELSEVQIRLQPGDEVEIVGQLNDQWLKITPPAGVHVYIWGEFTERITKEEASQIASNKPTPAPIEAPIKPDEPVSSSDSSPTLTTPVPIPAHDPPYSLPPVTAASQPVQEVVVQSQPASQPAMARVVTPTPNSTPAPSKPIRIVTPTPTRINEIPRRPFDARGILRPTFAVEPGEYGLRYTLSDGATHKRRAYIEIPPELGFRAPESIGKYVGVHGRWIEDQSAGVKVLRATHVAVLKGNLP